MSEDYRVPIERRRLQVWLVGGEEREMELFSPPDTPVERMLDDERAFLPAMVEDRICLVARTAVVALRVALDDSRDVDDEPEDDFQLPMASRKVGVTLTGGRHVLGDIRFVTSGTQDRTADLLNTPATCITLHRPEDVLHVQKCHVLFVVEEG